MARAWLDGREVHDSLLGLLDSLNVVSDTQMREIRAQVRSRALFRARRKLYDELLRTRGHEGTLGDIIRSDPRIRREVNLMLNDIAPVSDHFDATETCRVNMEFERRRVVKYLTR